MGFARNIIIFSLAISLNILPTYAGLSGKISRGHFFDSEKTIMTDVPLNKSIKTGKYWDMNFLYFNKYKPIFMLSNKDLIDFRPQEEEEDYSYYQAPPAVYSISLKNSTVRTVKLSQSKPKPVVQKRVVKSIPSSSSIASKPKIEPKTTLYVQYEKAMNSSVDTEYRINVAKMLKATGKNVNYNYALSILNSIIVKEPYNAYAFYLKGEIYSAKKDSKNAMANYAQSLKINPTNKECCLKIAKILDTTNKPLAQKYYNQALLLSEK